jgi:hypothetical protein
MKLLNLVEEATPAIKKVCKKNTHIRPLFAEYGMKLINMANKAPKFLLPQYGRILNDDLKGIPEKLNLPYPEIVIEYLSPFIKNESDSPIAKVFGADTEVASTKRIIVARQFPSGEIELYSIAHYEDKIFTGWGISPWVAILNPTEERVPAMGGMKIDLAEKGIEIQKVNIDASFSIGIFPGFKDDIPLTKEAGYAARIDSEAEIRAVLELLEALSCSNVRTAKFRAKNASKRPIKDPYKDHVYNILMVDNIPLGASKEVVSQESDHSKESRHPREHLRRGHIRRLQSGEKVWVQAHIVNPGVCGRGHFEP